VFFVTHKGRASQSHIFLGGLVHSEQHTISCWTRNLPSQSWRADMISVLPHTAPHRSTSNTARLVPHQDTTICLHTVWPDSSNPRGRAAYLPRSFESVPQASGVAKHALAIGPVSSMAHFEANMCAWRGVHLRRLSRGSDAWKSKMCISYPNGKRVFSSHHQRLSSPTIFIIIHIPKCHQSHT
jgi:hypothetical protein